MSVHVLFVSPLHLVFPTYLPLLNASTHHCLPEDKLLIPLTTTWAATRHVFLTTPSRLPQLPTVVTCSSIQPALAIFPSLSHFPHSLTSSSRDHLRNKPLELKSLSQCLPGSTFSTIFQCSACCSLLPAPLISDLVPGLSLSTSLSPIS